MPDLAARLARLRVPGGFLLGIVAIVFARPTWRSLALGLPLAFAGEGLRVWAAGHLEKNREVTSSGPYKWIGHPLYAGSALMGTGFAVASASLPVATLVVLYLAVALGAAIRTEQRWLASQFGSEYARYRSGSAESPRRFSLERAARNREHRAIVGLLVVAALLAAKAALGW